MNALDVEKMIESEVEFTINVLPEYEGPEGHFDTGNDSKDSEICRKIHEDHDNGNNWAWCTVEVVATWRGVSRSDVLGACSYANEKEFREGGYFEDMKDQALTALYAAVVKLQLSEN